MVPGVFVAPPHLPLSCCWPWLRTPPGLEHTPCLTPTPLWEQPPVAQGPSGKTAWVCPALQAERPKPGIGRSRPPSLVALQGVKGISGFSQRVELLEQLQALR